MTKIKSIIQNQTIRIDNHLKGSGIENNINDITQDVHIHKYCNIDDKRKKVIIKIPLNAQKNIEISANAPHKIIKEITDILSKNPKNRETFLTDIYKSLKTDWKWEDTQENRDKIAERIAHAFGLEILPYKSVNFETTNCIRVTYFLQDIEDRTRLYRMIFDKIRGFYIGETKRNNRKIVDIYLKNIKSNTNEYHYNILT